MSDERLIKIEAQLEAITQVMGLVGERHQQLSNAVDALVTQFIQPSAQQAYANLEGLQRLEAVVSSNAGAISALAALTEANERAITALAVQSQANEQQIAKNTEAIDRLEKKINGQSDQIQILIEEGRADRLAAQADREASERKFSEALAGIIANGKRIEALEQSA